MIRNKNFIVKICGVKDFSTVRKICELEPSMLGLVFVPGSIRCVKLETALKIRDLAHNLGIPVVGVFQNQEIEYVSKISESLFPDYVQLHGNEDISYCKQINFPVIKTIIPGNSSIKEIKTNMNNYSDQVEYFLIDRTVQGLGRTVNFEILKELTVDFPVIVAGGLNKDNIESAITPAGKGLMGVDTSSGVEDTPGSKDLNLIKSFIINARRAYESI